MSNEKEKLIEIAMNMILHAGNARKDIQSAIESAKQSKFKDAHQLMKNANNELILAHKQQTSIIQENISNDIEPNCLLFSHAQDTFMCVSSEYNFAKQIIELYEFIYTKIGD
ncbi:PTS lactose/cellobiose transporter subunit IIA [Coprobacillus sp. AF36-10BH]|nr:PTS lactose/cellobiose transporter subunit IIA [Coprobacillus sp. AF36-10BH]